MVKPADRKPIAEHLSKTYQLSERKACDLSGISRTGFVLNDGIVSMDHESYLFALI